MTQILTFPNVLVNSFDEITMIGGSYRELNYDIYDCNNQLLPLSINESLLWELSPFDQSEYTLVSKYGSLVSGKFILYLLSSDTENLSGKYIQKVTLQTGLPDYNYPLGRGIVNIIPRGGITYYG